jgi:hypothetical protein
MENKTWQASGYSSAWSCKNKWLQQKLEYENCCKQRKIDMESEFQDPRGRCTESAIEKQYLNVKAKMRLVAERLRKGASRLCSR